LGRKSKQIVSVVTADIIHSRQYSPNLRRGIDSALKRAFADLARKYPEAIHTKLAFRITVGDEFQCVFSDVLHSFDLLTYLRASIAMSGIKPLVSFRAAIGVGGISIGGKANPYEEDGEAFVRARKGVEQIKKRKRLTTLITDKPETDRVADLILSFTDRLQKSWTLPQWEAVKWTLLGLTREEISKKLDVAHQNVTKRLSAAGWQEFKDASQFLRELLETFKNPK
jgi:hypothetical protein